MNENWVLYVLGVMDFYLLLMSFYVVTDILEYKLYILYYYSCNCCTCLACFLSENMKSFNTWFIYIVKYLTVIFSL